MRRLEDEPQLKSAKQRGGYVLNVTGSRAYVHQASCVTVGWMNTRKKGGVYYSTSLDEVIGWLEGESIDWSPCKLCLAALSYRPRPKQLKDHLLIETGSIF